MADYHYRNDKIDRQKIYENSAGLKFLRTVRFVLITICIWFVDIALVYNTYLPEKGFEILIPQKAVYVIAGILWLLLAGSLFQKSTINSIARKLFYVVQSIPNFAVMELIFKDLSINNPNIWFTDSTRRLILSIIGTVIIFLVFVYGEEISDKYTAK